MRFNRNVSLCLLLGAVLLFAVGSTMAARRSASSDDVKGKNDTGCVEVLEARRGAAQCTGDGSMTVRAKVNCVKPSDVRICIKTNKGWSCSNHTNKQPGDEISAYECRATGDYVILKRAAGSTEEWQSHRRARITPGLSGWEATNPNDP